MGWLVDRLTPYKQREPRWVDLARALEHYWDTYNTPALERIEQMRSVFHAHGEDIERLLNEAGVQFEVAVPLVESNRAVAYAWRSYEIHRKDNADVLGQVLSRDFSGLDVRWLPLLARKSLPYGEGEMISEYEIDMVGADRADYHRTYRGVVLANLSGIQSVGHTTESFAEIVDRKIDALRPAHVVHEGYQFFQVFRAEIAPEKEHIRDLYRSIALPFGLWGQWVYDHLPADETFLDDGPLEHFRGLGVLGARIFGWGGIGEAFQRTTGSLAQHSEQQTGTDISPRAVPGAFDGDRFHLALLGLRGHHLSLDGSQTDGDPLDPEPLDHHRGLGAQHGLVAWTMPLWGLDAGQVIDGDWWGHHGVEGASHPRFLSLQHASRASAVRPVIHDGTTRRGRFSLPLDTNRYSGETTQVAASLESAGQSVSRQGGTRTERGPLPDFAAFDSLPADLAPLDMHYEDA